MKVNIIENKDRKTITLIIGGVKFFSAKYLLEKYNGTRYFGNGVLPFDTKEMNEVVKKIVASLNLVNPDVKVNAYHFVENDNTPFPLFKKHLNKEDIWDGAFDVSLSVFSEKSNRNLFFEDLARTKPVLEESVVREYEWGIELELASKIDEETLDVKIFTILHRMIKGKKSQKAFITNDSAWVGFDMSDDDAPEETTFDVEEELGFK